ncbi:glycosyl transferase [Rahnella sp. AA]|nr:glycosyl transferase [Rahnella sp. AA]
MLLSILLISVLLSWLLTAVFRQYAIRHHVMDIPNARSSHSVPTPRGGGMAVVISFLIALTGFCGTVIGFSSIWLWITLALLLIAAVGFIDDHRSLSPRLRLSVQFLSAALVLLGIGNVPALSLAGWIIPPAWWIWGLLAIGLVWFINLYNFMDGIDGLASGEAIIVGIAISVLHWIEGDSSAVSYISLILSASCLGFFFWNRPPAKIFMGDGCSGFLGLAMGTMMLVDAMKDPERLWAWLILLGVFVVDATWTLLTRWRQGNRLSEAHRSHAYQQAALRWGHGKVTASVAGITLIWLMPMAWLVFSGRCYGIVALVIAYAPLCVMAKRLNAGRI